MSKINIFVIWCICAAIVTAIFAWLYFVELQQITHQGKSTIIAVSLSATWLASVIELAAVIVKVGAGSLTRDEKFSLVAKLLAAIAFVAAVLGAAGDLSGH